MSLRNILLPLNYLLKYIKLFWYLPGAIVDTKGYGLLKLMFENANIPYRYRYIFLSDDQNPIFVDCGANVGLIVDIARFFDMEVYAFEPNPNCFKLLNKKFNDDVKVHILKKAVGDNNYNAMFFTRENVLYDQSATLMSTFLNKGKKNFTTYKVEVVRLVDELRKNILFKHKKIHLLKIDIEGAEFDVITDLIREGLYKDIKYIVCETHERFFKDGKQKIKALKKLIIEHKIDNIFLDWN